MELNERDGSKGAVTLLFYPYPSFSIDRKQKMQYTFCTNHHNTVVRLLYPIPIRRGVIFLFITLNYKSRTPICDQLCESIIQLTGCGAMQPGDPLPSVRNLAQELGINPNTVQKSYRILEQQGILESIPGKGSFIARGEGAKSILRAEGAKALKEGIDTAISRGLTTEEIRELCQRYLEQKEGLSHD